MNCRYFICSKHRRYTDAGYRWAYWKLEHKGIISLGQPVGVDAVLKEDDYWHPPEGEKNAWLDKVLANARTFLVEHRGDTIGYAEEDFLTRQEELGNEWREAIYP